MGIAHSTHALSIATAMAAKDIFHEAVRKGLEKEGWVITNDPLKLQVGGVEMYVDLGAEKIIAAEKDGEKIAVEIKSFIGPSNISEFHTAIGQFINYRVALNDIKEFISERCMEILDSCPFYIKVNPHMFLD